MPDQPSPRRRFQFRLRTMMTGVTLFAVLCGYVAWQAKIVRGRELLARHILHLGGGYVEGEVNDKSTNPVPWIRRLIGDRPIHAIVLPWRISDEECRQIHEAFPEAGQLEIMDRPRSN